MEHGVIEGFTNVLGKEQGYIPLYVKRVVDSGHVLQLTTWYPLPDELERLKAGAPVVLSVLSVGHPPVQLNVGEPPIEEVTLNES